MRVRTGPRHQKRIVIPYLVPYVSCFIAVYEPSEEDCLHAKTLQLTQTSGYVMNPVASSLGLRLPARACTVQLRAQHGQRIRLKLHTYTTPTGYTAGTESCIVNARVSDTDEQGSQRAICASLPGQKEELTSSGNQLRLELLPVPSSPEERGHFLFQYEGN